MVIAAVAVVTDAAVIALLPVLAANQTRKLPPSMMHCDIKTRHAKCTFVAQSRQVVIY